MRIPRRLELRHGKAAVVVLGLAVAVAPVAAIVMTAIIAMMAVVAVAAVLVSSVVQARVGGQWLFLGPRGTKIRHSRRHCHTRGLLIEEDRRKDGLPSSVAGWSSRRAGQAQEPIQTRERVTGSSSLRFLASLNNQS